MSTQESSGAPGRLHRASKLYPGAVVSILLALAAFALSEHYGAPVMLFALLLGMAVNFLGDDERCGPGIEFCATTILRTGVALLGLRITAGHLMDLGWAPVLVVVAAVIITIVLGALLARSLGLGTAFGVLTGGSVAICGVSAAIAISSVLPRRDRADKELVFAVICVTTLSTLAMIIYPAIAGLLNLGDVEAGVFLGGTIHDVAQVVGAGYSISDRAGDLATIVKLLRVAMLVPVVFVVMLIFRHRSAGGAAKFPAFLLAFVGLAIINSFGLIPEAITVAGNTLSRGCLVVAIAAVGTKTVLREVAQMGWPPVLLMLAETALIAVIILTGYILGPQLGWLQG
jgi:uncharacterized integral membrane protein (TIGR00698 family)